MIRPDHGTVRRLHLLSRPVAYALTGGTCTHGRDAAAGEPIVLIGSMVVQEPDGSRELDLSGAEWHPEVCLGEVSANA